MIYALDTNILSFMLRKDRRVCDRYRSESRKGGECIIPPIAYYEIKRGLLRANATAQVQRFDALCRDFGVGEMNAQMWDEAARIYAALQKQGRPISDADILIDAFSNASQILEM